jgi:hypothetical protein
MLVIDVESLPLELNPIVIPPSKVLPEAVLEKLRSRERGAAEINKMKKKAHAEKLCKVVRATIDYVFVTGERPSPKWIAQVAKVTPRWARQLT